LIDHNNDYALDSNNDHLLYNDMASTVQQTTHEQ